MLPCQLLSSDCVVTDHFLSAEAVEGLALPLEGVDNVHGGHGLAASVLGVGDRVADDVLKEDFEHAVGLLVNETGDALDTPATGETADGRLGDALDVVAKDLAMALGATLSETFTSFTATRHDELPKLLLGRRELFYDTYRICVRVVRVA